MKRGRDPEPKARGAGSLTFGMHVSPPPFKRTQLTINHRFTYSPLSSERTPQPEIGHPARNDSVSSAPNPQPGTRCPAQGNGSQQALANTSAPSGEAPMPLLGPSNYQLHHDRLGKFASIAADLLDGGMSFRDVCIQHRGRSCLADPSSLPHPASALLQRLRKAGAPALQSTKPWTVEELDAAVTRGPHGSTAAHAPFLRGEFADMVEAGQWLIVPYRCVRNLPNLRLSPTGVVPQRNRRPRPIVDYTFYLVNQFTVGLAPDSLQFGHALLRLLQQLHRADIRRGRIYISKTDVADAFMRIWIQSSTIPILGAVIPQMDGEEPLVAFPMILPMGRVDSPRYLCAITETVADLTNQRLAANDLSAVAHRLDTLADSTPADSDTVLPSSASGPHSLPPPVIQSRGPLQKPLCAVDVFMDDFILLAQLPKRDLAAARRTLFECIDSVLRPLEPTDNPKQKEPNSVKKLAQGDATWGTRKVVLGWIIDTVQRSIELPPHHILRLHEILSDIPRHQRRTSRKKWQCLLGELRSMILAIPGGRGLFSQLQSVLSYPTNPKPSDRLTLSKAVHDQLDDLRWLAADLTGRPTRWGELVDTDPSFLGAVDASGAGMGGVWLPTDPSLSPLMWRSQFTTDTTERLVSSENLTGTLTNSDLEQMGLVCHPDILAQAYDIRERTICAMSDNTAAISRDQRGSTSVNAPSSYLCRLASLHQRAFRYRLRSSYIPGPLNVMADALSRKWELNDSQLSALFNSIYPQARPWRLCQLRPSMRCTATQALSMKQCDSGFLADVSLPETPTPKYGRGSVNNISWSPTSPMLPIQSTTSKCSLDEYAMAGFQPAAVLSDLQQWRMPSNLWHRRSPSWVPQTPVLYPAPAPLTRV